MRKKAILIVGLALLIAAAGVVYAHWTETLQVHATVNTGSINVNWIGIWTDDDNGNVIGEEFLPGGGALPAPLFGSGSVDPSSAATVNATGGLVSAATRYDKAIGNCASGIDADGHMWVSASNVYPSYHCTIWSQFNNTGSVPVKVQSVATLTYINNVLADISPYGDWDTLVGTGCGLQIDPNETFTTVNTFHILQPAAQNATYSVEQVITLVNWNEWDAANCAGLPLHH
jgi:hypothetical protein